MVPLSSLAERALDHRLAGLRAGRLVLRYGETTRWYGDPTVPPERAAEVRVLDRRAYRAIALGGAVGAGEAYAEGWWTSPDLTAVIRLLVRNRDALDGLERGVAAAIQPLRRAWHALNRNSRRGSRRNISAHYDLGNDFFATFLDETLTYSSAVFERPGATLADASIAKYDRLARLVDLRPGDRLVEIGTGWGGFAIHAARHHGARVTTTTISRAQHALATERVRAAGLADRVTVLLEDYRDLRGTFDKLVSIEMIEAVGHEHFDTFYATAARLLAPHGRAAIQAITIADERYEGARREVDFIKRHIFPGSCIPSRAVLAGAAARTDLRLERADEIGPHYAETLRRWRLAFAARADDLEAMGYDARFRRLWEFYFCYCEGGFLERAIGTAQLAYAKPAARPLAVSRHVDAPPPPALDPAA
jgi:cyclopropane-fatty-acyl-phospholipid synthase